MARRRRPGHRTSVVDGRAEIIVPVESIENADSQALSFAAARAFFSTVNSYPTNVDPAPRVSLTLDRFVYDLHLGDLAHQSETHDGDVFVDAVRLHGHVTVLVVDQVDPRRSTAEQLDAAARDGSMLAGSVAAFVIDMVDS
ncbi:MAG: hypothetical protein AB8G14_11675 [Ilumatobacter sp.]